MSIQARCPNCDASYTLAESQRGKKVRCRKCSETFVVSDGANKAPTSASVAKSGKIRRDDLPPPPRTPPPKAKPAAVRRDLDRDLDDDEEDDDRRDRREPRKKSGSAVPLILMICGGVLLLLLLGGGVIVFVVYKWGYGLGSGAVDAVAGAGQTMPVPNGIDPNNPGVQPGANPQGPDEPKDVADAMIWIRTAQTADHQNRAAEWLAKATVVPEQQKTIAALLEGLAGNPNTHSAAVKALAQWAGPEDIPTLISEAKKNLNSEASAALVRLKATEAAEVFAMQLPSARGDAKSKLGELCQTGDPAVLKAVEKAVLLYMDDPNKEVRTDALGILQGGCGTKPETLFTQAISDLRSTKSGYAGAACEFIATQPVDAARQAEVAKALEAALSDPNGETRKAAATALETWATKDDVKALIAEMDRKDGNTFEPCVIALTKLADEDVAEKVAVHLKDFGGNREVVARALQAMGPVARKAVAAYVTDPDAGVRSEAERLVTALNVGDDVVFDARVKDLTAKDGAQRKAACDYLADHPPVDPPKDPDKKKQVARALEPLLADKDNFFNRVPEAAAKALAVWGDKDSATPLLIAMQKPNSDSWQACVDALVKLKEERVVFPLLALVEKNDIFHKDAAVKALNDLGPVVESALDKALNDPAATLKDKVSICQHLTFEFGTKASLPALQTAAMDTNPTVKTAATAAINAIKKRNP